MVEIDGDRLLEDLRVLAQFGKCGTGVDRIAFSAADISARRWLVDRMQDSGLEAGLDRYANVLGRAPGAGRTILVGSHTDSVPQGGWLDGALGVAYGLEISRALMAEGVAAVDVISFQDEEGTFVPCLGSKAFCGALTDDEAAGACNADGLSLAKAMAAHELGREVFALDPSRQSAFFEAHIEQGPRLEEAGCPIGVVTGVVGVRRYNITATGRADHAGTTPMGKRHDAGATLVEVAHSLLAVFRGKGEAETVWNIGAMAFKPGAPNVVPAEASMSFEFRDNDPDVLDRLELAVMEIVAGADRKDGVRVEALRTSRIAPVRMDEDLTAVVSAAAEASGIAPVHMSSGAAHDAMVLAARIPSALAFVPSIGGRSHSISEDTRPADIVAGCQVMANAIQAYLAKA